MFLDLPILRFESLLERMDWLLNEEVCLRHLLSLTLDALEAFLTPPLQWASALSHCFTFCFEHVTYAFAQGHGQLCMLTW